MVHAHLRIPDPYTSVQYLMKRLQSPFTKIHTNYLIGTWNSGNQDKLKADIKYATYWLNNPVYNISQ